ncbi:MAG: hypothetical protein AB7U98_10985 [Candidatus Nitrosocosmicus sp.]
MLSREKDVELILDLLAAKSKREVKDQENECDYKEKINPENKVDNANCRLDQKNKEANAEHDEAIKEAYKNRIKENNSCKILP